MAQDWQMEVTGIRHAAFDHLNTKGEPAIAWDDDRKALDSSLLLRLPCCMSQPRHIRCHVTVFASPFQQSLEDGPARIEAQLHFKLLVKRIVSCAAG